MAAARAPGKATVKVAAKDPLALPVKGAVEGAAKSPAKRPGRVSILSYNVCGGSCAKRMTLAEWTSQVVRRVEQADADVILLQELCRGQHDSLKRALAGRYDARWVGTMNGNEGCGKQWGSGADASVARRAFGLSTFVKGGGSIRDERTWWLPNQGMDEPRALLCVDATVRGRAARVCNTHLDWHSDTQEVQAAFVARIVTPWAERIPVVLGGDLNAEPTQPSMGLFYDHSGGRGVFQEVDETDKSYFGKVCPQSANRCRSGEGTDQNKKLDYIFLSRRHFSGVEGDAIADGRISDHDLLRGTGSWRELAPHADFSWSLSNGAKPASPSP